ncbi:hypothetical protein OAB01_03870 [Bacteroidia bacterium]|jgi:hypothetical protein|nr:hypothetical protein [Bacteroidia bacterium]
MKTLLSNTKRIYGLLALAVILISFNACDTKKNEKDDLNATKVEYYKNMQSNVNGYMTKGFNQLNDEVVAKTDCFRFTYDAEGKLQELAFVIKGRLEDSYTYGFAKRVYAYTDSSITYYQCDKFGKKLPLSRVNGSATAFAKQIVMEDGLPAAERGLDFDDQPLNGFTEKRFECDSLGRIIWESSVNNFGRKLDISRRDGIFYRRYTYTEDNLLESTSFYEIKEKKRSLGGIHKVRYQYNENGNIVKNSFLDEQDQMKPEPGTGIAYRMMKYNSMGNMLEQSLYGTDDQLVVGASGYARQLNTFDQFSNNTSSTYFGADKKPVENKEIAAYREQLTYDDRGDLVLNEFFNSEKELINSAVLGYAYKAMEYNDMGLIVREAYYDNSNKPIIFKGLGAHAKISAYSTKGELIQTSFQNTDGEAFMHPACNCASITFTHDSLGNVVEESYMDMQGLLTKEGRKNIAKRVYNYNRLGLMELTQYYDANGQEIVIQGNQPKP